MKIFSTALGMELDCRASSLSRVQDPDGLVLKIDSISPLPMEFVCRIEPRDIRALAAMVLKPAIAPRLLRMILRSCRAQV